MTKRNSRIGLLLVALLVLMPSGAIPQSKTKANTLKKNLSSVQSKKTEIKKQIQKAKRATTYVMQDIEKVDGKLDKASNALQQTLERQNKLKQEAQKLESDLKIAENVLEMQTATVRKRIRSLYIKPEPTAIGSLLGSNSLAELASRKSVFERIAESDSELFQKYKSQCLAVEAKKKQKLVLIAEAKDLEKRQRNHQAELKEHRSKKREFLAEIRDERQDLEAQFRELDAASRRIEAQLRALLPKSIAGGKFLGRFIRPVSGRISSGFGMRRHPVLGRSRMHSGIDFAAPTGTTIRAAASGTVVTASYMGGYGNTVVIDHGGGYATLYGHCSRLFVRSGQKVSQGQSIAAVGSTGLSTGPHLHFEIRVNGRPINPAGRI